MYQAQDWSTEHSKGYKTVPGKVATTCTEDGHTDYQNKHYNINRKDEGTQDDRGRGGETNYILRFKEQDNMPNTSGTS